MYSRPLSSVWICASRSCPAFCSARSRMARFSSSVTSGGSFFFFTGGPPPGAFAMNSEFDCGGGCSPSSASLVPVVGRDGTRGDAIAREAS
eukprot:884643-Prymnesium_polylepis.1